ncbi:unnamed protein product [Ectocarpus sp. 6 AP-2014]
MREGTRLGRRLRTVLHTAARSRRNPFKGSSLSPQTRLTTCSKHLSTKQDADYGNARLGCYILRGHHHQLFRSVTSTKITMLSGLAADSGLAFPPYPMAVDTLTPSIVHSGKAIEDDRP